MFDPSPIPLNTVAVIVDPARDDIAVAKQPLHAGTLLQSTLGSIRLAADIAMGHRFAIRPVPAGAWVRQYAQPFARSLGLQTGDPINASTTANEIPQVNADSIELTHPTLPPWPGPRPTFMGFARPDGRAGTRNWVLIVPTSMCSSHEAATIAARAEMTLWSREQYPNVDGVAAIPHTRGCGCPDMEPTARTPDELLGVVEGSLRMLSRYIAHPNVGAVLVIELGCEKTNLVALGKYIHTADTSHPQEGGMANGTPLPMASPRGVGSAHQGPANTAECGQSPPYTEEALSRRVGSAHKAPANNPESEQTPPDTEDPAHSHPLPPATPTTPPGGGPRGSALSKLAEQHGKPLLTLSIQNSGGTAGTIQRGLELLPQLLAAANQTPRTPCDIAHLAVGLKCGGSDAFSGITANPALGVASDLLVRAGATTIITEITEFFGAEHLFAARAKNRKVAADIFAAMARFKKYVDRAGGNMADNPSPGNKEGGLLNITIKSLGALAKSGRAPVQGVLDYAEDVFAKNAPGLWLLYCSSYDQESVPAQVAAGCQIVCFTTGRGTGIGNAIAPVLKIGSNTPLYNRMKGDIDYSAGTLLDANQSVEAVGHEIFNHLLAVASGQPVKAEANQHREFMIWNEEGISL
jgi:altronate dehydratase